MDKCVLTPGCGFPVHLASDHPCGWPVRVGDACAFCGEAIAAGKGGEPTPCPRCWRPITIADMKALAADAGLAAEVKIAGSA